ncbi:MAG TPA: ATP-binding protein [Syntrophorhabdales bacterium]|nr:ATP-binding protein [Syntrophorhabdales bacterium]
MKRSIFSKVLGGYLFIIVALSACVLLFSFNTIRQHYLDTLTDRLQNTGVALRPAVVPLLDKEHMGALNDLLRKVGQETDTRVTVIDAQGVVLADSQENPNKMENHGARPEVVEAHSGKTGRALRFSSTKNQEMLYVAVPLEKNGRVVGVLRTSLFLTQIESLLSSLKMDILKVALIITVLSLIGALLFSNSLSRPIKELMAAASRIGSGDFSARVFLKKRDEIGTLADTFNYMTERLSNSFSELSREKQELDAIISSLKEGLVVLDKRGAILHCNDSFRMLTGAKVAEGQLFWEVFRNPDFTQLLEKSRKERKGYTGEVEFADKTYACSVTFLEAGEKTVSVFHDITEIKKLERVKKDFVVNVSHELRTPLTAIKGFVETLEEEVTDEGKHYLDIIQRNTDRLINIVSDLLLLSELEEKEELQVEKIDLKALAQNVLRMFDHRLKEKGLTLSLEVAEGLPGMYGDPFKLEQMFVNLMDNALKYTEKGGITVSFYTMDGRVSVQVKDTGIGIPKQDLSRIFERFYVVDKSRSRRIGGTGLGLSIVKHIVLLHNGTIDVQSSQGVGTTVTVTFPVDLSTTKG